MVLRCRLYRSVGLCSHGFYQFVLMRWILADLLHIQLELCPCHCLMLKVFVGGLNSFGARMLV